MTSSSFEHQWKKRAKWLTQALIISGTLNIGLLATFIYFVLKEKHISLAFDLKPLSSLPAKSSVHLTNEEVLQTYAILPFQELLLKLENPDLIEEGYAKRDLALACLVAFHHFHLERALGGLIEQKRQITFSRAPGQEQVNLIVFPGLVDYQYEAIINYAKTEKWPFNSQGLFFEIKYAAFPPDPSLLEAFYLTPEFPILLTLFSRTGTTIEKEKLVNLLVAGDWELLKRFSDMQKQTQDFSIERRREFLLEYFNLRSLVAAELLLEYEIDFVAKRFDDAQIFLIFDVFNERTSILEKFAKELLSHPRSDAVWKKAAALLYGLANESVPDPYSHEFALQRFLPQAAESSKNASAVLEPIVQAKSGLKAVTKSKSQCMHVVQQGESLWKIARKYHVSVDAIIRVNHLESDRLRPGRKLEIPEN